MGQPTEQGKKWLALASIIEQVVQAGPEAHQDLQLIERLQRALQSVGLSGGNLDGHEGFICEPPMGAETKRPLDAPPDHLHIQALDNMSKRIDGFVHMLGVLRRDLNETYARIEGHEEHEGQRIKELDERLTKLDAAPGEAFSDIARDYNKLTEEDDSPHCFYSNSTEDLTHEIECALQHMKHAQLTQMQFLRLGVSVTLTADLSVREAKRIYYDARGNKATADPPCAVYTTPSTGTDGLPVYTFPDDADSYDSIQCLLYQMKNKDMTAPEVCWFKHRGTKLKVHTAMTPDAAHRLWVMAKAEQQKPKAGIPVYECEAGDYTAIKHHIGEVHERLEKPGPPYSILFKCHVRDEVFTVTFDSGMTLHDMYRAWQRTD